MIWRYVITRWSSMIRPQAISSIYPKGGQSYISNAVGINFQILRQQSCSECHKIKYQLDLDITNNKLKLDFKTVPSNLFDTTGHWQFFFLKPRATGLVLGLTVSLKQT